MIELGRYDGGKGQIFRQLINQIPPHDVYVAAFAGSDAIALNKRPARLNILIDKDEDVLLAWLDHLVKNGGTAVSSKTVVSPALSPEPAIPGLAAAIVDCDDNTWWLIVGDALGVLPPLGLGSGAFVYADPPYLMSARSRQRPLYKHEFGRDKQHKRLITMLQGLSCRVMLSGYRSELYDSLLVDWRVDSFRAVARSGRPVWEFVWCNYSEPLRLHDYGYLGKDFRERERIKRKANRWVNRFESLPVLERRAIVQELETAGVL
jgi:DNA adenine methylase